MLYNHVINRVLLLLDGLDEVHSVGNLANICQPAGHPDRPGLPGKGALATEVSPLEFTQCLLTGSLLQGILVVWITYSMLLIYILTI